MPRERYTPQEQAYYQKYISSALWRAKKKQRIAQAGHQCEFVSKYPTASGEAHVRCHRTTYLCVHHNTYERLGAEKSEDLDVYCWFHHMLEHLLWKRCDVCTEPCLSSDDIAEKWLEATLLQMGIDLERNDVPWKSLPTKEQLGMQIHRTCMHCRGVQWEKP